MTQIAHSKRATGQSKETQRNPLPEIDLREGCDTGSGLRDGNVMGKEYAQEEMTLPHRPVCFALWATAG
jgi:hypothetical protein